MTAEVTDPTSARRLPGSLARRLEAALQQGAGALAPLADAQPVDRRDRVLALLAVYDLHTAPLEQLGAAAVLQHHPVVAGLKVRLEREWLDELDSSWEQDPPVGERASPAEVVAAMRVVAARDRLPAAYRWVAREADREQLVAFLSLEGGPDGGFDDLVAQCQIGLSGTAKLELGKNYWDEMGRGELAGVHTQLHHDMARALGLVAVPRWEQPVEALERAALSGLLATNRYLQPELIGALGLLELQAGPRCRLVLQAFDRLDMPQAAYPFYLEHAEVDPVHGKDWMDKAIEPLAGDRPGWGARMVKGAWWRAQVNLAFFAAASAQLQPDEIAA